MTAHPRRTCLYVVVLLAIVAVIAPCRVSAQQTGTVVYATRASATSSTAWPAWHDWRRLLTLAGYNARIVICGTTLLGAAAGMVGSFTLLRKRALMGDALSHATLPGIALAFIVATANGYNGKSLSLLLLGATLSGLVGVAAILVLRNLTRLKEDTALGIVLSVFFGAGITLLAIAQRMQEGNAAGLEAFIYGKTASMGLQDIRLISMAACVCIVACLLFFKELKLLCFDEGFAGSRGVPVLGLDLLLMSMVIVVTIVGLQAVGLILMIAMLVIPAAAARFWTDELWKMFAISGILGALGGMAGAGVSALFARLPSGAMIVLVCTVLFAVSMLFGSARGVSVRWLRRVRLNRAVDRQHLLRAMYEQLEGTREPGGQVALDALQRARSWSKQRMSRVIRQAEREGLLQRDTAHLRLTAQGQREAARLTRQHRLWEMYLIKYADVAPGRVDRDADAIEHVLQPQLIAELEGELELAGRGIPASPHQIPPPTSTGPTASRGGY